MENNFGIVVFDEKCPECGDNVWAYIHPNHDSTLGIYCCRMKCQYVSNKNISLEELEEYM